MHSPHSYVDRTHTDFAHGVSWSSDNRLFTCGWDSKVIAHDIATATAKVMGNRSGTAVTTSSPSSNAAFCMNGDVIEECRSTQAHTATNSNRLATQKVNGSTKSTGSGSFGRLSKVKSSYSRAIQNGSAQAMEAEG